MGFYSKGKISKLKQLCDRAMSSLIREKESCEKCGIKNVAFDTAHVFNRKNLTLRWDLFNLLCLCRSCHLWGHAHPKSFMEWFKSKFPDRYFYLELVRNRISKLTETDYEEILINISERNFKGLIQDI